MSTHTASDAPVATTVRQPALPSRALDQLLADASQFPPSDLSLDAATVAHVRWWRDPHGRLACL